MLFYFEDVSYRVMQSAFSLGHELFIDYGRGRNLFGVIDLHSQRSKCVIVHSPVAGMRLVYTKWS